MVYITGDTHSEFERFSSRRFPQQKEMTRADYLVICGDFGGVWDNSSQQRYWLDWLEQKPFTTLFVDGNHENFDLLQQLPCREWQGGQVHVVRENILHLMRGEIFTFAGRSWFAMGGGASHDMPDGILDPEEPDFALKCRRLRRRRALPPHRFLSNAPPDRCKGFGTAGAHPPCCPSAGLQTEERSPPCRCRNPPQWGRRWAALPAR